MGIESRIKGKKATAAAEPSANGHHAERPTGDRPAEWEPFVPLEEPADAAPPFPLESFPAVVAEHVAAVAESVYCPPDYPAVATLAAASASIGGAYVARVKADFFQGAGLYCAIVGEPSAKKSPPIKHVIRPIQKAQSERVQRMREEYGEEGEGLPATWGHGEGELFVQDVTAEKLAEMLQRQPRGLLLYRPELIGWLLGQNQYKAKGTGADRSFFLEVYDSEPITVHRKNMAGGVIYVAHPSLTMVGATQPDVVRDFFTRRDGLAERILWTLPQPMPPRGERWDETPRELSERWSDILRALRDIPMRDGGQGRRPRAKVVRLGEAARPAWTAFTDRLAAEVADPDFPPWLRGSFGKFEGTCARLALILQALDFAAGNGMSLDEGDEIEPRWVEAAAEMCFYFGAHARRVHAACGSDPRLNGAKRILLWINARKEERFHRADLWRALRRNSLFRRPEDLSPALSLLVMHNAVRVPAADRDAEARGPGRSPGAVYEVNPDLLGQKQPAI